MTKFWRWSNALPSEPEKKPEEPEKEEQEKTEEEEKKQENILFLHGAIAEESWFDDDITPQMFRDELEAHEGNITVYINSPGGDCIAASEIYTMLMEHKGDITIKIDGMAASAASVIAMAGTTVLMAPTSLIMIHNPATMAFGDHNDMKAAAKMLDEVKDSIIKAYEIKTGLSKDKISAMMEAETWMSADKAIELGFADGLIQGATSKESNLTDMAFSQKAVSNSLYTKLVAKYEEPKTETVDDGSVSVDELMASLDKALLLN